MALAFGLVISILLSFLLSFGSQLEVLSPAYWRDVLVQESKKISDLYET